MELFVQDIEMLLHDPQGGPQMIPLKNLEWCGVSMKVKILEGENTDQKKSKTEKILIDQ